MARIIASASAENVSIKYLPPVTRGLESWHFLNESLEKISRNYAPGKPDASVAGAPVINGNFTTFKGLSNFLQTEWQENVEGTFFMVARTSASLANNANTPMYFGTFQSAPEYGQVGSATTFGISITHNTNGMGGFASRGTTTDNDTSAPAFINHSGGFSQWGLYSLTVGAEAGPNTVIRDHTRGVSGTNTSGTTLPRYPSLGKYRIGSGFITYAGECDMALFAGYSSKLDDNERNVTVANIREYAGRRGIIV